MIMKWVQRGLAALGIAAASGCATAPQEQVARPALWQVADKDTTIYLFGTIHVLPDEHSWRTPTLEKAIAGSTDLIVETIIDPSNPQKTQAVMLNLAQSPGLPPLQQRLPEAKRADLTATLAQLGIPAGALDRFETWAAALIILQLQLQKAGLESDNGVEFVLKRDFAAAGKPIGQLETNEEQFGFFDTLPEDSQRLLLEGSIERPEELRTEFGAMLAAWTRGDVAAIARSFNREFSEAPALEDALLKRRNANWARWIEQRLAQPGKILVAVGAGHLAGDTSVQSLLKERGIKVTRLQ
ncbi:TraB/GumN family protein [Sphingomonas arenae]|uniref:TraB/GumN family protein n=2 Tax=Sphingomonas arenae TaxID=2812555 RepID=UPI001967BE1E|nr:TraB/GumN family protein [Sphingomonas arenae]